MIPLQDSASAARHFTNIQMYDFIFVQWLDWMGTLRARCVPANNFSHLMKQEKLRFGISRGNLGTLQNDASTPVSVPVGQILVRPDLDSLRTMHQGKLPGACASVLASFEEADGTPVRLCPRSCLAETVDLLHNEFDIGFLIGFEIEVTFCRRVSNSDVTSFVPLDQNHAWATLSDQQYIESFPLMLKITQALSDAGISVQQMHSEAGPGQYEFVLSPLPPIQAVDTLVQARQMVQHMAAAEGLRATFHPQPFPGIGTACHVNISLNSDKSAETLESQQMSFMAGVLAHLPALCAFTMPEQASYSRVVDDSWTSGTWVSWGTHNREAPLRRVDTQDGLSARWEIRCVDGLPNMYLVLHALVRAGLSGMHKRTEMMLKDCLRRSSL